MASFPGRALFTAPCSLVSSVPWGTMPSLSRGCLWQVWVLVCVRAWQGSPYKAAWSGGSSGLVSEVLGAQGKEPVILMGGMLEGFLEAAAWGPAYEDVGF